MSSLWPAELNSKPQKNEDQLFAWFPTNNDSGVIYDDEDDEGTEDMEYVDPLSFRPDSQQNKRDFSIIYEDSDENGYSQTNPECVVEPVNSLAQVSEGDEKAERDVPDAEVYPVLRVRFDSGTNVRVPLRLQGSGAVFSRDNGHLQGGGNGYSRTRKLDWYPEGNVTHTQSVRREDDGSNSYQQRQDRKQQLREEEARAYSERYIQGDGAVQADPSVAEEQWVNTSKVQYGYGQGPQHAGGEKGSYLYKALPHSMALSPRLDSVRGIYTNAMTITPYNGHPSPRKRRSEDDTSSPSPTSGTRKVRSSDVSYNTELKLPMVSSSSRSQLLASSFIPPATMKTSLYCTDSREPPPQPQVNYAEKWNASMQQIERVYTPTTQYSLAGPVSKPQSRNNSAQSHKKTQPSQLPPLDAQRQKQNKQKPRQTNQKPSQSKPNNVKTQKPRNEDDDLDNMINALESKCGIFDDIIARDKERKTTAANVDVDRRVKK